MKSLDVPLWNGNRSQVFIEDNQMIMRDLMPGPLVQKILDENHRLKADGMHNRKAHGRIVARVPNVVRHEWWKTWKAHHSDKWTWQTYQGMMLSAKDHERFLTSHLKNFR